MHGYYLHYFSHETTKLPGQANAARRQVPACMNQGCV